ncbi:metallophosphoesterase [Parathalassolituus penaei]|uniref:Metallophosphoesterase n=1 Tax=Parathalassolituus penaei TaxID=2997323 RepID=A0A9X3EB82_9GAMM|nr:metallophosphoesterase [Parathalassolituus penaei]MCY0964001.1 metallophosphoesterase [Parathalassolituus penaei]
MTHRYFDIVGDIHGHADALERLLEQMGYQPHGRGYRQDGHQLLLVGDLIDRGPQQRRVLELVRAMRDGGDAVVVMGNHEFNALCFAKPKAGGGFVRPHNDVNRHQHEAFLAAFPFGSAAHAEALDFFRTLPLWLDTGALRVIHACWHQPSMQLLEPWLTSERLNDDVLLAYGEKGLIYDAIEVLLKGPETQLPADVFFEDKDGKRRTRARINWWKLAKGSPGAFAVPPALLHGHDMSEVLTAAAEFEYHDDVPLFFGHYWQRHFREPETHAHAWCLDYSVAAGGQLVGATVEVTDGGPARLVGWNRVPAFV